MCTRETHRLTFPLGQLPKGVDEFWKKPSSPKILWPFLESVSLTSSLENPVSHIVLAPSEFSSEKTIANPHSPKNEHLKMVSHFQPVDSEIGKFHAITRFTTVLVENFPRQKQISSDKVGSQNPHNFPNLNQGGFIHQALCVCDGLRTWRISCACLPKGPEDFWRPKFWRRFFFHTQKKPKLKTGKAYPTPEI